MSNAAGEAAAPSLVGLPPELIRHILKYLLPYREDIVLHPKEYFYSTESLVPAGSPVRPSSPAVLASCRLLYSIGSDLLYSSNTYRLHFKASRQYKWPKRNPRHGMVFPLAPRRAPPRHRRDGSYSGFDRLPRAHAWRLRDVRIEVRDNLDRGFLELRECFEAFAHAVGRASPRLASLAVHVEAAAGGQQDYQSAFVAVYAGDDVPRAAGWLTEQKVKYMLEPLIDVEGLASAAVTGAVDDKFAARLVGLMTSTGGRVARGLLHLKSPKLHWMKRQRESLGGAGLHAA